MQKETIVAQASAPGRGGVAIVRFSGRGSLQLAQKLFKKPESFFSPRKALFVNCFNSENKIIDEGLCLYFKAPASFTGEDVIEFQCHGSPVVVEMVLEQSKHYGARQARPGEFSERAFLNNKIDLTQAEAIADLIDSQSKQAAQQAVESLKGKFSEQINRISEELVALRVFLEATIDFPDEEGVDFINESRSSEKLSGIIKEIQTSLESAQQNLVYQEGIKVVLAGEPNVGKSSLLNALADKDSAIVSNIAGTTRDVLKESINIKGLPLEIIDTAGLREGADPIEKEGIRRAWQAIEKADLLVYLLDVQAQDLMRVLDSQAAWMTISQSFALPVLQEKLLLVINKIDTTGAKPELKQITLSDTLFSTIHLSAKTGDGLELLKSAIFEKAGIKELGENVFAARRRHLDALNKTLELLMTAQNQLQALAGIELVAEDLRLAQQSLGEITGKFSADDLLGTIFSSFCIGK